MIRFFDYFFTVEKNWFISSSIEKSFACIDLVLCFGLWMVIVTSPEELDQGELLFEEDEEDVLVLPQDGRVVRNGRLLSSESSASPFSSVTFSWMNQLLKLKLNAASLWALPLRQRARENYRLFTDTASASSATSTTSTNNITVHKMMKRIYLANKKIIWCQFITAIGAVLFHYANPFFLRKLLNYIQEHHTSTQQQPAAADHQIGYLYCVALFVCNVTSTLVASQTLLWGRRWHVSITHMLNSEIYAHALRLKHVNYQSENKRRNSEDEEGLEDNEEEEEEEEEDQVRQQASLMSQDTERLAELASYLHVTYILFKRHSEFLLC